jgi:GH24 family phage-related lysozyme (muramidase)
MGGKTSQSTSTVSIPPEVLARYNAVNARAEEVAKTPFQQYGGQFVAGLTPTQQAGIQNTSTAAGQAQPYYGAATGLALAGTMPISPGGLQTGQYMNPFTEAVAAPTYQALRQQQGQERAQQQAQAIKSGAFGGDRAGLERANLARQQELGTAQAIAPIFQQGYQQALGTAQQQQGVNLAAEQANRAAFQQGAQQIAGLGTGAQQAALQGAQAQLAAGTAEQQTNQADLTARYQQFLQERGYPFQTAQFLANIAMGTGALSGSTTTSTQPAGFFSDERLKEDIKRVGETDDGLPIYSYRYKGDKKTQIGLIAQDVEKQKPEAVGLAPAADGHLYKTVDYKKATEDKPHKAYGGGLDVNSMGGAVMGPGGFAPGGFVDGTDMKSILAAIGKPIDVYGNKSTLGTDAIGGAGIVPSGGIAVPSKLATASNMATNRPTTASDVVGNVKSGIEAFKMGKAGLIGSAPTKDDPSGSAGLIGGQGKLGGKNIFSEARDLFQKKDATGSSTPNISVSDTGVVKAAPAGSPTAASTGVKPYAGPQRVSDAGSDSSDLAPMKTASLDADLPDFGGVAARGGLIVGRHHYEDGGDVDNDMNDGIDNGMNDDANEDRAHVPSSAIPSNVLSSATKPASLPVAQTHQGRTTMDDIKDMFGMAKTAMSMGAFASGGGVPEYGLVVRQHHQDGERVVADDAPSLDDPTLGLIAKHEGFRERPYYDVNALRTGFGSDTVTLPDGTVKRVDENTRVTMDDAKRDLARRAGEYQNHIKGLVGEDAWGGLDPNTRAALTSVTYNYGRLPASVAEAVKKGDRTDIASAVNALGVHNQGVNANRRAQEAGLIDPEGQYAPVAGRSDADLPSSGAREAQYQAIPQEGGLSLKGVGDTVTSDKFLVPFLSFVGSTLASKSPTLGGALGEGIVGGVSGYQQNKKVQAELAKGVLDIVKDRFNITSDPKTGQTIYFNKATGQTISAAQYAKAVGDIADSMGVPRGVLGISTEGTEVRGPSGVTQPGQFTRPAEESMKTGTVKKAEVAGTEKKAAEPEITDTRLMNPNQLFDYAVANKEKYKLVGDRDPDALLQEANEYKRLAASARLAGKDAEATAATQNAKDALDRRNQYVKDAISFEVKNNQDIQTAKNEDSKESYKAAQTREQVYKQDRALITRTSDILADYRAGRFSDARAGIAEVAGTLGIPLPGNFFNAAANDELIKNALTQVVAQVGERQLGRAPGTAIKTLEQTVAGNKISPGGAFALLGRTLGDLDMQHDSDEAYLKKGRGVDHGEHVLEFNKKQNPHDYYRRAYSSIPEPKGMEPGYRESLQKTYKYEPKVRMTTEEAAPAAPAQQAAPIQVQSIEQARKLPSGTVFTDPNGVVRRVP